jgi:cardiolipin synthase A/B
MSELIELIQSLGLWAWGLAGLLIHVVTQLVVALRVVMSRRGVGETLSWILVVFTLPVFGPLLYLLIGELRLGRARAMRVRSLAGPVAARLGLLVRPQMKVNWDALGPECEPLARAGFNLLSVPALPGNQLELYGNWEEVFDRMVEDIDSARINCDLEFYIWHPGGKSSAVIEALERAAQRGVTCRILVDALGSRKFLGHADCRRLRAAGVEVQAALPGGLWRIPFVRFDLRLHRKIVLIDDHLAWTGSLNLVDPRFFKQDSGVGQWVDAMVRIEGPAVEALAITFQTDWHVETCSDDRHLPDLTGDQKLSKPGSAIVQALPSGPANQVEAIEQILITAIFSARRELVITTPYFIPSEALQMALAAAAQRGVKVILIVPAKVDSLLVRHASRAFKGHLLAAGVHIAQFAGGLLHTKSVTVDGEMSLFGSLNMDARSLRLNFEITLAVYDREFTAALRHLQQGYIDQSVMMDPEAWNRRPFPARLLDNLARLLGPLL